MRKGFVLLMCCVMPGLSQADIYRWVDDNGRVQFSDKPPQETSAATLEIIKEEQLQPANSFAPQHKHYQGTGTDYFDQEQKVKAQRKARRLERERQQAAADKKQQKCRKARDDYRILNISEKRADSLASLMKQRQRRDRIKEKIKRYCY